MTISAESYAFLQNRPTKNAAVVEKVPERCLDERFSTVTDFVLSWSHYTLTPLIGGGSMVT